MKNINEMLIKIAILVLLPIQLIFTCIALYSGAMLMIDYTDKIKKWLIRI